MAGWLAAGGELLACLTPQSNRARRDYMSTTTTATRSRMRKKEPTTQRLVAVVLFHACYWL